VFSVDIGRLKVPADGGTIFINRTEHAPADFSGQALASGLGLIGAFHDQMEIIELFGHFNGDAPRGDLIGFGPVKGGPEKRAAGATFHAGIDRHFCLRPKKVKADNHLPSFRKRLMTFISALMGCQEKSVGDFFV
jgi:hypothetical protein